MQNLRYTSIIIAVIALGSIFNLSGCKNKDENDGKIDKTALLVGTWTMTETTDPANAPVKLQYTFEETGTFIQSKTVRKGRAKSITTSTWRFTDAGQTKLEISMGTMTFYTIEILDETTLRLNDGTITLTFTRP